MPLTAINDYDVNMMVVCIMIDKKVSHFEHFYKKGEKREY